MQMAQFGKLNDEQTQIWYNVFIPLSFTTKKQGNQQKVLNREEFRLLKASLTILHPAKILASVVSENLSGIARK